MSASQRCRLCGTVHPPNRKSCTTCDHPDLFITDDGICVGCGQFDGQTDLLDEVTR